jgi:hypothetical protein
MASDRMMQAIGSLERAIARLEQVATTTPISESPPPSTPITSPAATAEARAALKSLDLLIADLKSGSREAANG